MRNLRWAATRKRRAKRNPATLVQIRPPNQKESEDRINIDVATNKEQKTAKNSLKTATRWYAKFSSISPPSRECEVNSFG